MPPYPNPVYFSDKEQADRMRFSGKEMEPPHHEDGKLAEIVLKACAFHPKDRYASACEMREALQGILDQERDEKVLYPDESFPENDRSAYVSEGSSASNKDQLIDIITMEDSEKTRGLFGQKHEERYMLEKIRQEEEEKSRAEEEEQKLEEEIEKKAEEEAQKRKIQTKQNKKLFIALAGTAVIMMGIWIFFLVSKSKKAELADSSNMDATRAEESEEIGADLSYPIMSPTYDGSSYMVNEGYIGKTKSGTYEEMMASLIDDGIYPEPMMDDKKIYTATQWDDNYDYDYSTMLSCADFVFMINWMREVHEYTGADNISSGSAREDVEVLAGRWSGGGKDLSISFYPGFSNDSEGFACREVGNIMVDKDEKNKNRNKVYLMGTAGSDIYVYSYIDNGGIIFRYKEDGTMEAWSAAEETGIEPGTQFQCVEKFKP